MKAKELKQKDTEHLKLELVEQQKHLFTLRTQAVTEKLEDPSQLRKSRREIARLKTALRQREIEASSKEASGNEASSEAAASAK
jgi:large subunit ribosomal protein L29